ncbi:MAG: NAD(P)/FAD-dependent oxidoreductase [Oscillospiraceae bacterium]|nr:NAD(P)/FAD-dependent oxidoreductase [Oscillospiraceae bacterium]
MYDVIIIGAGAVGCAIARELSRFSIDILVLEAAADCAAETSRANSGIVHAGYDAKPGSHKGRLNAAANRMFDRLSRELDFPFRRSGALVLAFHEHDLPELERLREQGERNGVPGLEILDAQAIRRREPNIAAGAALALYVPSNGLVSPYEMTIAYAENAVQNGVKIQFGQRVAAIEKQKDGFTVKTDSRIYQTRTVVNAAGLFADRINNMVSESTFTILPRKGEYVLYDKAVGDHVNHTLFQLPTRLGKGVLVTPTVEGNLLIGPNAVDQTDRTDDTTTAAGNAEILEKAALSVRDIPYRQSIKRFAGLRAQSDRKDFILEEAPDAPGFFNAAGIDSPGISCAPLIGGEIARLVAAWLQPALNPAFEPVRPPVRRFREMTPEQQNRLIAENPLYGHIVCRCETVSEGEIVDAIRRPAGATTVDGIKYRTRAGLGRCQSGFCSPRIAGILARELGIDMTEITQSGGGSYLFVSRE